MRNKISLLTLFVLVLAWVPCSAQISPYAALNKPNTFTAIQTFSAGANVKGLALTVAQASLVNGTNENVNIQKASFIQIAGPSSSFSIGGFITTATSGSLLVVENETTQTMTLNYGDTNSAPLNRIAAWNGTNSCAGVGCTFIFIYDYSHLNWQPISVSGGGGGGGGNTSWSSLTSPIADLNLSVGLNATYWNATSTNPFEFLNITAATSSVNQNSPRLGIGTQVWNGTTSIQDLWTMQVVAGTGTNPTSIFTFGHAGSSGTPIISVPSLALSGAIPSDGATALCLDSGNILSTGCSSGASPAWSAIGNATTSLILQNGTFGTTFNQTTSATWHWTNVTSATSVLCQNSPTWSLGGTYWTGSVSQVDAWTIENFPCSTSDSEPILAIGHAGNPSAIGMVQLPTVQLQMLDASFLSACDSSNVGRTQDVDDSNTNVWGAVIAGGGSFKVTGFCDGTSWTVAAATNATMVTESTSTTGYIPKWTGTNVLGNSLLDDGVTTANTLTYSGAGGLVIAALKITGIPGTGCLQIASNVVSGTGSSCAAGSGGTNIFNSFQAAGNSPITTAGNYLQIALSTTLTSTYSGAGTSGSPYIWTLALPTTAVSAGSYTLASLTVDAFGRITAASNGTAYTNPMTTLGDTLYENASPAAARLAGNTTTTKKFLVQTGTGSTSAAPAWGTIANADIPNPTLSALGGVEAINATTHEYVTALNTSGILQQARPADTDLSGTTAGALLYINSSAVAELATVAFSVMASGATNPTWVTPTGNSQCFQSAASSYATSLPVFGSCTGTLSFPQAVTGSVTSGGIPYFSTTTQMASTPMLTQFQILLGGGTGNPPYSLGSTGSPTTVLHGGSGNPSFGSVVNGDLGANAVNSAKMSVNLAQFNCDFDFGDTSAASALSSGSLGPQKDMCLVPKNGTILEMEISSDAGTPSIIVGRNRNGTVSNVVSSALATAASGGRACSNPSGTVSILASWSSTTCSSTLQNTGLQEGDTLQPVSGSASTARWVAVHVVYATTD